VKQPTIGVLALQGDYARHCRRLEQFGASSLLIRKPEQLKKIGGLVIPGGESGVLLKLLTPGFRSDLKESIADGLPVLATCAGTILLASQVENPHQESFALLDVDVRRNAYGRQVDSFIDEELQWTEAGRRALQRLDVNRREQRAASPVEGVFIRAPRISRVGDKAEILLERPGHGGVPEPVLVRQNTILGATFHPELSEGDSAVHELFLALALA
jgi:5'-phosphate synthase pdxT subunit